MLFVVGIRDGGIPRTRLRWFALRCYCCQFRDTPPRLRTAPHAHLYLRHTHAHARRHLLAARITTPACLYTTTPPRALRTHACRATPPRAYYACLRFTNTLTVYLLALPRLALLRRQLLPPAACPRAAAAAPPPLTVLITTTHTYRYAVPLPSAPRRCMRFRILAFINTHYCLRIPTRTPPFHCRYTRRLPSLRFLLLGSASAKKTRYAGSRSRRTHTACTGFTARCARALRCRTFLCLPQRAPLHHACRDPHTAPLPLPTRAFSRTACCTALARLYARHTPLAAAAAAAYTPRTGHHHYSCAPRATA